MKRVFPVLAFLTGAYWLIVGLQTGVWVKNRVGGGFVPAVAGALAIVFSLAVLLSGLKKDTGKEKTDDAPKPDDLPKLTEFGLSQEQITDITTAYKQVKADAGLTAQASGMTQIKGSMVKIN